MAVNTNRLLRSVNLLKEFTVTAKGVYSDLIGAATNHGTLTFDFYNLSFSVVKSVTFSLTGSAADYSYLYSGYTSITYVGFYCTATESNTFHFNNGCTIDEDHLVWRGWIKPENITRPYYRKSYTLALTAICGLADLKNVPYPTQHVTGYTSLVRIVQRCLTENGIPLAINVQNNIYENILMGSNQVMFNKIEANQERLIKSVEGRITTIDCYSALVYVLGAFNSTIYQANGTWYVQQENENANYFAEFPFDNVATYARDYYDRARDVSIRGILADSDELSKIPPYKAIELTYRNRNLDLADSIVPNGTFDSNITGWANSGFTTFAWDPTSQLAVGDTDPNSVRYFKSPAFTVTKISDADYLDFQMDITLAGIAFNTPGDVLYPQYYNPFVQFSLINPTGGTVFDFQQRIADGTNTYYSSSKRFKMTSTGSYQLKIIVTPDGGTDYDVTAFQFDNIKGFTRYSDPDLTKDHFYLGEVSTGAVNKLELETFFGDGIQSDDISNLKVGSSLTSNWSSNNGSGGENLHLQDLLIQMKLMNYYSFKNYLRLTLTRCDYVTFNTVVTNQSKYYSIISYRYDIHNQYLELELEERLNTPPTVSYSDSTLSTIDGE